MNETSFLETIWGAERGSPFYGELRLIRNGIVTQEFVSLRDGMSPSVLEAIAEKDAAGWDAYYGVLPRTKVDGTAQSTPALTYVLWADFDAKAYPSGSKAQAFYALGKVVPVPHIIVDSGHGYHAYWLLAEATPFARAARAMKGIALATGADRVYDAARILRVPGTHNHKDEEPALVRILRYDVLAPRYYADQFSDYTFRVDQEEEQIERAQRATRARRAVDSRKTDWGDLPGWLVTIITTGRDQPRPGEAERHDRSVLSFKVCARLLEAGWTDEEIEDVFLNYPDGIGEKMYEKGEGGRRWLQTTLRAAHRQTGI